MNKLKVEQRINELLLKLENEKIHVERMKIFSELEKLNMITLNEREQSKWMVENGLMDKDNLEYANYDPHKDEVDLSSELMDELEIKDYLIELCKKENRQYKI